MEKADAWKMTDDLQLPRGKADPFSAAVRSTRMPIIVTDASQPDNPIVFANDAFLTLTGYARNDITGRNCRFLQGPDTDPNAIAEIRDAVANRRDVAIDILNYKKDGTAFWNALYLSPVPNEEGGAPFFFATQFDATERKQHEFNALNLQQDLERLVKSRTQELEQALTKTTLLMHEVDHRVKNNLQMISAMLMMQSMSIPDIAIKNTLQEMLERVDAMGLVHKRLYQSADLTEFDIAAFTREIAGNLVAATGRADIELVVDTETVTIRPDDAACIALVINETITNALKHAFPVGRRGDLHVSVKPFPGACEIAIRDDGPGMPAGSRARSSFGKTLIETLIQQLKATIEWLPASPGTLVKITLPLA